jgi:hypothetical protein
MDINKEENLINKDNTELKEMFGNYDDTKGNNEIDINYSKPKENNQLTKINDIDTESDDSSAPIGKKTMNTLLQNLNSYWLELIGSISLMISLFIYEIIGLVALEFIYPIFKNGDVNFNKISEAYEIIFKEFGIKWLFFITMSQHLSVGFFCLTTFSNMFHETKNIKKFFIINILKVAIFYGFSVFILKVIINDGVGGYFKSKIEKVEKDAEAAGKPKSYAKTNIIFEILVDKLSNRVANFLSIYNTFLEKTVLGSLYIFLFNEPKALEGKKLLFFRLLSIIPISFMIISLVLRALHNTEVIELNEYVLPLLLGPKITVYGFFISTLLTIKYKSLAYNVFDEENYIDPRVFTKIGSKNFGIFGIIELLVGLFCPSWSVVGIGGKYLLVLCAPIMTLYNYKKKYKVAFPFCKKGDMSRCLRIVLNIIGYFIIFVLSIPLLILGFGVINEFIAPVLDILLENFDFVVKVIEEFL